MSRPLRFTAITAASPLLRAGPPAGHATVLNVSRFPPPDALPLTKPSRLTAARPGSVEACLPKFRAEAADRARAAFMPDAAWPIDGHPPGSSRTTADRPGFDVTSTSRHVINGSLTLAFPIPT